MSDDDLIRRGDALKLMQLAIDVYGQNMRGAADKKEKRDWQSMLISAVDIRYAIKDIPAVQVTAYSENGVAALVEALREANGILEDALQEVGDDYPGSNCQAWCQQQVKEARAALASVKGGDA